MKKVSLIGAKFLKEEIIRGKLKDFTTSIYLIGEIRMGRRRKGSLDEGIRRRIFAAIEKLITQEFNPEDARTVALNYSYDPDGMFALHLIGRFRDIDHLLRTAGNIRSSSVFKKCAVFDDDVDSFLYGVPNSLKRIFEDGSIAHFPR